MDTFMSKNVSPSPKNFAAFLPWACRHLDIDTLPIITIDKQNDLSLGSGKQQSRDGKSKFLHDLAMDVNLDQSSSASTNFGIKHNIPVCYIQAMYDSKDNLVQIKFNKNTYIPRAILRILLLIEQFYKYLTAIHIDGGLKYDGLYELDKLVSASNITEVILDHTVVKGAQYHCLLDHKSKLKYLSLAGCKLMDDGVKEIANRLVHPLAASKSLKVLNLSSNQITDVGAQYVGDMLRTNRQLAYLNLASNMITDIGADSILNSLVQFPLTTDELRAMKLRHITYLKHILKQRNIKRIPVDKKIDKKKTGKPVPLTGKKSKSETIEKAIMTTLNPDTKIESSIYYDPTTFNVEPFNDPYSLENTNIINNVKYCLGNNTLNYLSLAYNNLSYFSIKRLYNVLSAQRSQTKAPKGLVNVCIEGNKIPQCCTEMTLIEEIIKMGIGPSLTSATSTKRATVIKVSSSKL
ncbi:unnamed protein product [Arctia plantaginis]|uniref:Leucine-rich repeat-containing protein 71 n=1 Tax=Arctia plantaginis TaxID=874455 RepID=A0A8S0ZIB6_ARCPL|nr:unnamed protein product [Arctia plantaginis]